MVTPTERRAVVSRAQAHFQLPLATACRYVGVHRALLRYQSRRVEPSPLVARLHALAAAKPRWVERAAVHRLPTPAPPRQNVRWSMDFVRDTTREGRPFRIWALVDDGTRECPQRVVEALDALLLVRRRPTTFVCDSGTE
jgi:transposase InsO family protein